MTGPLTDEELKTLAKACKKLRSINTKKSEARKDYVNVFSEHHALYSKVITLRDKAFEERIDQTLKRADFTKLFVKELRERQEKLTITKYLLNDVKFGFITNIVNWVQHPELLSKKTEYKPRKSKEERKANKKTIKSKLNVSFLSMKKITVEVNLVKKDPVKALMITIDDKERLSVDLPSVEKTKQKSLRFDLEIN